MPNSHQSTPHPFSWPLSQATRVRKRRHRNVVARSRCACPAKAEGIGGDSVLGTVQCGVTERRQRDPPPLPGASSGESETDSAVCHFCDHWYIKDINIIHLLLSISSWAPPTLPSFGIIVATPERRCSDSFDVEPGGNRHVNTVSRPLGASNRLSTILAYSQPKTRGEPDTVHARDRVQG